MTEFKKEEIMYWQIIAGSLSDLSKLDFSPFNIQYLDINSTELDKILGIYDKSGNIRELLTELKEEFWDKERLYITLPVNFSKRVEEDIFWHCWQLLLLLFPSDVKVYSDIQFQFFDDLVLYWNSNGMYHFSPSGYDNTYENYLIFHEESIPEINKFIQIFCNRFDKLSYIHQAFYSYTGSFSQRFENMEFIGLCMSLEAIVDAHTELNYRLKRNVAILLGDESDRSQTIFDNIGKIYKLRSKIVHAGKYKDEKVAEYMPYLRTVVSRMIIEVILQNVPTLTELNKKVTSLGFGDREKISSEYEAMNLNITSYIDSFIKKLK